MNSIPSPPPSKAKSSTPGPSAPLLKVVGFNLTKIPVLQPDEAASRFFIACFNPKIVGLAVYHSVWPVYEPGFPTTAQKRFYHSKAEARAMFARFKDDIDRHYPDINFLIMEVEPGYDGEHTIHSVFDQPYVRAYCAGSAQLQPLEAMLNYPDAGSW